jgi:hypothetical protein
VALLVLGALRRADEARAPLELIGGTPCVDVHL